MSLHYRGVVYESASASVAQAETSEVVGHYRGATWKIHPATAAQPQRANGQLKYRGAQVG